MPFRSPKMNPFIFGFQRRVWCPKCTPASRSSFMVTGVDKPSSLISPGFRHRGPELAGPARGQGSKLPLAELEAPAGALLSVLLPLLDPGVPGQEPRLFELAPKLGVEGAERPGDAVPERAGLGRHAAPMQGGEDVELLD